MSIEKSLRAMVATKQLEIDKLKRKIKELEYINDSLIRISEEKEGYANDDNTRQRSSKTRKASKRTSKSSDSNK